MLPKEETKSREDHSHTASSHSHLATPLRIRHVTGIARREFWCVRRHRTIVTVLGGQLLLLLQDGACGIACLPSVVACVFTWVYLVGHRLARCGLVVVPCLAVCYSAHD